MGCATPKPAPGLYGVTPPPIGGLLPDVSMYQGAVNWAAVKAWQGSHHWTPAGIFKLGEYGQDPEAARNAAQLHALGMWSAGYWFIRNIGCSHEAALIAATARTLGVRVVVLDMEVPEAHGYAPCLSGALHASGLIVVIYTAAGTWPGGGVANDPLWDAAYGPAPDTAGLWTGSPIAWQFSSSYYVPGIGTGDISIDYGITRLGVPVPAPRPKPVGLVCFPKPKAAAAAKCKPIIAAYASDVRAAASSQHGLASVQAGMRRLQCRRPYRRGACVHGGQTVTVLSQRVGYFSMAAKQVQKAHS